MTLADALFSAPPLCTLQVYIAVSSSFTVRIFKFPGPKNEYLPVSCNGLLFFSQEYTTVPGASAKHSRIVLLPHFKVTSLGLPIILIDDDDDFDGGR